MKNILIYLVSIVLFTSNLLKAQSFELVGPRSINFASWDVALARSLYFDNAGTLYNYVSDASPPRSNELVKYNLGTNTWTNMTNNSFAVPGGSGDTGGVPMADGSIFTITKSFGNPSFHYAYIINSNGSASPLSSHPSPVNDDAGIRIWPVQAPNGDIYYSHTNINAKVERWDGNQWTQLPNIASAISGNSSLSIGIDDNNVIYAAFIGPSTGNRVELFRFNPATNTWDSLYLSPQTGQECSIYVVDNSEVYIYYASTNNCYVTKFDGSTFTSMGTVPANPVESVFLRPGAMIKSQVTGELYLASFRSDGNGFYRYDVASNTWDNIVNDIADGGIIVDYHPTLAERNGEIFISFNENNGITTVKYNEPINCPPTLIFSNTTVASGFYKAAISITADNTIASSLGSNVHLEAGQCILLDDGVEILGELTAVIDGCN